MASINPTWHLYSLNASAAGTYQSGSGRINGVAPDRRRIRGGVYETIDREVDLFNLMILPRAATQTDADMESSAESASVFCQQSRAFLHRRSPRHSGRPQMMSRVRSPMLRIGLATDHAAIYWPRLAISDNG